MEIPIEPCDEGEVAALDAFLVDRIYEFNARATGHFDARSLGGCMRDEAGRIIAGLDGHTWAGCCVVMNLWVHESWRGKGLGRALLEWAEAEAARRGCEQVVLSTHDFQAPGFYERLGYERRAVIRGWPRGHADLIYAKPLCFRANAVGEIAQSGSGRPDVSSVPSTKEHP